MKKLSDHAPYVATPDLTLREVLERFNTAAHQFLLVADGDGRLVGTVTDGDVRRGILQGLTLAARVGDCMHKKPVTGRLDDPEGNAERVRSVPFLPVLDAAGRPVEVLLPDEHPYFVTHAVVMAGGLGTRLGDLTRTMPKPLLPVGGKPLLEHVLEKLEATGIPHVWIAVNHLADRIEDFVRERDSKARVRLIRERHRLGTAGALGLLPEPADGPVLVINADVLTSTDFVALDAFHKRHDNDATIAVAHHRIQIPYGIVRQNEDGLFERIDEKPVLQHFVAAGIYYLSPDFLALVPPDTRMDMPDLLAEGRRIGLRIGLFPIHEYWADVGRPEDLEAADAYHNGDG